VVERLTVEQLFPPPDYAHVAIAEGRAVFTAGAVPLDRDGNLVGEDDYAKQTDQVLDNLVSALEAAGAKPHDIVKTVVYVVAGSPEPLGAVWEIVRRSKLSGAPSTLLGVSALGYTGQLVEIEAVAVVE
jgi:enamine deaminase RidA (YjgF/YER057c/UK114 family)